MTALIVDANKSGGGIVSGSQFSVVVGSGGPGGYGLSYTYSTYLRYESGDPNLQVCVGNEVFANQGANHCLTFNSSNGGVISIDPIFLAYTISQVGNNGWWRISVSFRPIANQNGTVLRANLSVLSKTTTIFDVWDEQLDSGDYPIGTGKQVLAYPDQITSWSNQNLQWKGSNSIGGPGRDPIYFVGNFTSSMGTLTTTFNVPSGTLGSVYYAYIYCEGCDAFAISAGNSFIDLTNSSMSFPGSSGGYFVFAQPRVPDGVMHFDEKGF